MLTTTWHEARYVDSGITVHKTVALHGEVSQLGSLEIRVFWVKSHAFSWETDLLTEQFYRECMLERMRLIIAEISGEL